MKNAFAVFHSGRAGFRIFAVRGYIATIGTNTGISSRILANAR